MNTTTIDCKITRPFIWEWSQTLRSKKRKYWCVDFTDCTTIRTDELAQNLSQWRPYFLQVCSKAKASSSLFPQVRHIKMANIADSFYSCLCTNIAGIPDMDGMDLYFYKYTLKNTDTIIFRIYYCKIFSVAGR